jgi:hypothetical protein
MNPIYDFKGQVALVTGAAKGMVLASLFMATPPRYGGNVNASPVASPWRSFVFLREEKQSAEAPKYDTIKSASALS